MAREVSSAAAYFGAGNSSQFDRRAEYDQESPPQPRTSRQSRAHFSRHIPALHPSSHTPPGPPFASPAAPRPPPPRRAAAASAPCPRPRAAMSTPWNRGYDAVPSPPVHRYLLNLPDGHYLDGSPLQPLPEDPFKRSSYHDPGSYPSMSPASGRPTRLEFDEIDPSNIADEDEPADPEEQQRTRSSVWRKPAATATYSQVGEGGSSQMLNVEAAMQEKPSWRQMADRDLGRRKRNMWIFITIAAILVVAGTVTGAVVATRSSGSSSPAKNSSSTSPATDSDLTINSPQIKALLNNTDLHRVFPVIDYTPANTQWPDCLSNPPDQNNITMDLAMLSQLTPNVRLYGTDCNQTEMTLTAISRLGMNDTMKLWLGVWIDNNQTTNTRQLNQMYDILTKYPTSHFLGAIVGNEVLFRKDQTESEMVALLNNVRSNFTSLKYDLSVSTSDLGSSWTANLANASTHIMGNIHPFFAGVTAEVAASWTYDFWQTNDVAIDSAPIPGSSLPRNIISETGWPSGGGNDCGTDNKCSSPTAGSVAGIDELNTFLEGWVCDANANGTMYFWFEAFDEPWKVIYNTPGEAWEDKWGIMTADRKLKDNVTIPDCGGKTL